MLRLKTIFNILLIFLFVLSCSSSNDKPLVAPPKEKVSLPKLWGFAMDDFNEGKAEGAIEKFKMVEKDYSYTEWAPKSLLMMAYVYYEANRCVDTLSVLERYVKFYPNNPERVYVEYLKGVCYFEEVSEFSKDQEKTVKAITQFKSLINSYPNTEYADDAKYKLDLLNDLMAGKEMYVARYYMNKQKWAAAINRLKIIVEYVCHIIRDSPDHNARIMGGLWGLRKGAVPSVRALWSGWTPASAGFGDPNDLEGYGVDQNFACLAVYPRVAEQALVHFSHNQFRSETRAVPFPFRYTNDVYCGRCQAAGQFVDSPAPTVPFAFVKIPMLIQ